MSRNMKEANARIFSVLTEFVRKSDSFVELPEGTRFVKTDQKEKEWLQKSKISDPYPILPGLKVSSLEFGGKKYFIVIGWEPPGDSTEILTHIPLNAGLVTALIYELNISVRRGIVPLSIVNEVLFQYKEETDEYPGHDFDLIIKFFEPFHAYEIKEDSPIDNNERIRIAGHFICENNERLFLPFSSETVCKFEKLFMEGVSDVPYENLLLSLTSIHWKFSFLDVYRCLEQLFPIVSLNDLHQSVKSPVSLSRFSEEIEEKIGWRPKDAEAIHILLKNLPGEVSRVLQNVKASLDGTPEGDIASFFYKIRNSIVHYRTSTPLYAPSKDADWDNLVRGGLSVIEYWYKRCDSSSAV